MFILNAGSHFLTMCKIVMVIRRLQCFIMYLANSVQYLKLLSVMLLDRVAANLQMHPFIVL